MKQAFFFILIICMAFCLYSQNYMNVIAQFQGEHNAANFGSSLATVDFNHDGIDDLIVSSKGWNSLFPDPTNYREGKVYIYFGGSGFNNIPDIILTGQFAAQYRWVTNIGDVNGDGFDDLYISGEDSLAQVLPHVKYINIYTGGTTALQPDISIPYNWSLQHDLDMVSRLGDINNDGFDDLGVGIFYPNGALDFYIIWGGSFIWQFVMTSWPGIESYGRGFNGIGDINNDGYDDFSIGYSSEYTGLRTTLITLYYGNQEGTTDTTLTLIQTNTLISEASVPIGDINGDGISDFMGYSTISVLNAWLGSSSFSLTPSLTFSPTWMGEVEGHGLKYGDLNADGFDDVVGTNYYQQGFCLWLGRALPNGNPDLYIYEYSIPSMELDYFGYGLTLADYNADGYCDIAVSAPFTDYPFATDYRGYVFVFAGNAELADTTVSNEDDINQTSDLWSIAVYPNPSSKEARFLFVEFSGSGFRDMHEYPIALYDTKGHRIMSEIFDKNRMVNNTLSLYLPQLKAGVYILKTRGSDNTPVSRKIVIK